MPVAAKSLLDINDLSLENIHFILKGAEILKATEFAAVAPILDLKTKPVVMCCFLEPSTRTKNSFEMACARLGFPTVTFVEGSGTSMTKGETEIDTFHTLKAMRPDLMVIRFNENPNLSSLLRKSGTPIISAGEGRTSHPTQALLDALTIQESFGSVEGLKILFCGDTAHSRVAHSGINLFKKLGAKIGLASPETLKIKSKDVDSEFRNLKEAATWADVVIGLRIQKERHSKESEISTLDFRLDEKNLAGLGRNALIMHPGPFLPMVDFDPALLNDRRCRVHEQVTNGVYVRASVILFALNLWDKTGCKVI